MNDSLLKAALSLHSNPGAYALLLGSGVSRSAGIPTGWEIVVSLINKPKKLMCDDSGDDAESWYLAKFVRGEVEYADIRDALRMVRNLVNVEQPIICAINGHCMGVGTTVALLCDIIFAAKGARIGDPHVRTGAVAGDGVVCVLPFLVGIAKAKELLLTGDAILAEEAERLGMINRAVPPEELMPTTMALAHQLANGPQKAIRWTKQCLQKLVREQVVGTLDYSLAIEFAQTIGTDDQREAWDSFLENRPARFKGSPGDYWVRQDTKKK